MNPQKKTPDNCGQPSGDGPAVPVSADSKETPKPAPGTPQKKYDFGILDSWVSAGRGTAEKFCERYWNRYICFQRETRQYIGEALHPGEPYMRKMLDNLAEVLIHAPYAVERYELFATFDTLLARIVHEWKDAAGAALDVRAAWQDIGEILDDECDSKYRTMQWKNKHGDEFNRCYRTLKTALRELSRTLLIPAAESGVPPPDVAERLTRIELKVEGVAAETDMVFDAVEDVKKVAPVPGNDVSMPVREALEGIRKRVDTLVREKEETRRKQRAAYEKANPRHIQYEDDLKGAFKMVEKKIADVKKGKAPHKKRLTIFEEVCANFSADGWGHDDLGRRVRLYRPLMGADGETPMDAKTLQRYFNTYNRKKNPKR